VTSGTIERSTSQSRSWRPIVITLVAIAALLLPIGAVLQVVLTAQFDDRSRTQAIIVLDSARYWGDPRAVRQARWEHAAELYGQGVAPVVVLTGPRRASASARDVLIERGVPAEDVVVFPTTPDTVGSLRTVGQVMRDLGWQSATFVTDRPHAARAGSIATGLGIDAHLSPTHTGPGTALTSEYVGWETAALLRHYMRSLLTSTDTIVGG
jgi:uncharacterized SAM-binding protein YcdF (DUF218 family)